MLEIVVRYLHNSGVPFRLASYPSLEDQPAAGHPMPPHAVLVDSTLVTVNGMLVLACFPVHDRIDLSALGNELGGAAVEASHDDLPERLQQVRGALPPLGQFLGVPLIVDERVCRFAVIVFQAFDKTDYFEINYDDFARQEQPRIASFVRAGALPQDTPVRRADGA